MDLRMTVLLGLLMLMVYPNMYGKSSGVLGHPSGHRLRRSTWDFCRVKSYTQNYMKDMMTLATEKIMNDPLYRNNCRSGCEISFLNKTNVCHNGSSVRNLKTKTTVVLERVMAMMYDLKVLIDFVRGHGNIQAQDNHPLWRNITDAFWGIDMGWNNATSLINITVQAGRPVNHMLPAIATFNGDGNTNELRRGYIVARDINETVRCSLNMMTDIC